MASNQSEEYSVELVATGNELIYGRIVDTNSSWLAGRIWEEGGQVSRITLVGDSKPLISDVLLNSLNRHPKMLIVTGGLGPTFDDITAETVAETLGRKLTVDYGALEALKRKFEVMAKERGINSEITPQRRKMACIVEGATPIPNPVGLAVGMMIPASSSIVVLPGVPKEMMKMFDESIAPVIRDSTPFVTRARSLRVWMRGYAGLSPMVEEIMKRHGGSFLKTYAGDIDGERGMRVDVIVRGASDNTCTDTIAAITEDLDKKLADIGGKLVRHQP
ncbi:MAG: competence/damage-inducible protein A [Thaumarchaeota archaeon]|nr:competence/damage-inducible protein A [Nitrososphaerota archaeon]